MQFVFIFYFKEFRVSRLKLNSLYNYNIFYSVGMVGIADFLFMLSTLHRCVQGFDSILNNLKKSHSMYPKILI